MDSALPEWLASSGRPPRYSAMSRFWSAVSFWAGRAIVPVVTAAYTDSGVNSIRVFRSGARSTRLGPAWQVAQFWLNSVCPGDVGRGGGPGAWGGPRVAEIKIAPQTIHSRAGVRTLFMARSLRENVTSVRRSRS